MAGGAVRPSVDSCTVGTITILGTVAFGLSVAAEITRTKTYSYRLDAYKELHCTYPSSPATSIAIGSLSVLTLAQTLTILLTGTDWYYTGNIYQLTVSRVSIFVCLGLDVVFYCVSMSTLITGAVENAFHTKATSVVQSELHCHLVDVGFFASGAAFAFAAMVMMVGYYWMSVVSLQEAWSMMQSDASDAALDMEKFPGKKLPSEQVGGGLSKMDAKAAFD